MRRPILSLLVIMLALISCSPNEGETQEQQPDYQKIKEMTLDVLHTPEGKKALQELMAEPEFKQQIVISGSDVEQMVAKSFTDEKTKKEWEKILQKPQVAANLAKVTEKQQKQLLKDLMKDPEYQKMMLDLLKDPQISAHILQLMKSQQHRKEVMKIMEEALKVPSFQEKLMKLMEQAQKKGGKKGGQGGGGQGGGDGESGGGGGGGGESS
jgi:spore germination protein D